jgi:hypothetical protein
MMQRLFLSMVFGLALLSSGLMSCGSNGPGGEVTDTEESGSETTTPTAGGTTGTIEPPGGTTGGDATGGGAGGTTTTGGGTGTSGTTTTGGGTSTGGSGGGSGGTFSFTGGASICLTHPIICEGLQPVEVVPALTGGSPIGGPAIGPAVGGGGVGDIPAPDSIYKVNPIDAIRRFGQKGVVTSPVIQEDLVQGGTFTAPDGFVMINGVTKEFTKGTVVTVTKDGVATATTPEGAVETVPTDATLIFTGGAAVTRNGGASAFTLQPGHAVRFGAGNMQIFQSYLGGIKAPAVERQIGH